MQYGHLQIQAKANKADNSNCNRRVMFQLFILLLQGNRLTGCMVFETLKTTHFIGQVYFNTLKVFFHFINEYLCLFAVSY